MKKRVRCRLSASLVWRRPVRLDLMWIMGNRRMVMVMMWCTLRIVTSS